MNPAEDGVLVLGIPRSGAVNNTYIVQLTYPSPSNNGKICHAKKFVQNGNLNTFCELNWLDKIIN